MDLNAKRRPLVTDGVRRDDQHRSKISSSNNPRRPTASIAPIRIVVAPTVNGGKWVATFDGETICTSSSPLVRTARTLLDKGFAPGTAIEMWREGADAWALRGRIGAVAATLIDGETAKRPAKNGAPIRFPGMAATTLAEASAFSPPEADAAVHTGEAAP
jgi:hypothetical protein